MDLRAVRYAVTLSEELHFGRAAQRHYIAQQPFGQRIRQLEHELGYPLFERSSRRVSLAPRGESFVAKARDALALFEELSETADSPADGTLVVGILGFGMAELWSPARQLLRRRSPQVRLAHRDLDIVNQYHLLRAGEVDAAIVHYFEPVDGMVFDIVHHAPRVAVVPAWSKLAERDYLTLSDVQSHRWAPVIPLNAMMASWLGPAAAQQRSESVRRPDAIPTVVATTDTICLHAAKAEQYYPNPNVRYIPMEGPGCDIAVATREGDERPTVQALRRAALTASEIYRPASGVSEHQNEFV